MVLTLVTVLGLVAAACSSDEGGGTVAVTLQEFAVVPAESSIGAGEVTFEVTNEGPDDVHEFVVFKTDLAPDALPTGEDGSVDEAGEGLTLIDEIEDIAVGDAPISRSTSKPQLRLDLQHLRRDRGRGPLPGGHVRRVHGRVGPELTSQVGGSRSRHWGTANKAAP
jgi:hypothetical protein